MIWYSIHAGITPIIDNANNIDKNDSQKAFKPYTFSGISPDIVAYPNPLNIAIIPVIIQNKNGIKDINKIIFIILCFISSPTI